MTRLILALILAAGPAGAAPQCAPTTAMMEGLTVKYGEAPIRQAMAQSGTIVMWLENVATGTWTVIETRPDGQTCILSFGTGFEALTPEPQGTDG